MKRDPQLLFLVGINLLVLALGAAISKGAFVDPYNLQSMAGQLPELGLLAVGVMLAMSSGNGGIDLSGIALANLSGVASAIAVAAFVSVTDAPMLFTVAFIAVAVLVGLVGGVVNGLLIARLGLTPILCTLGTQLLFTGLAVVLSGGPSVRRAAVFTRSPRRRRARTRAIRTPARRPWPVPRTSMRPASARRTAASGWCSVSRSRSSSSAPLHCWSAWRSSSAHSVSAFS